jgi:hypothetical protein
LCRTVESPRLYIRDSGIYLGKLAASR